LYERQNLTLRLLCLSWRVELIGDVQTQRAILNVERTSFPAPSPTLLPAPESTMQLLRSQKLDRIYFAVDGERTKKSGSC